MKKLILGGALALLATAGAVYAYRTVQYNANHSDQPFTFLCPMSGKPIAHRTCPSQSHCDKSEAAAHSGCCQQKAAAQATP